MAIKFDINCVYSKFGNTGNNDLKTLLSFLQQEPSINTIKEAAYALATFAVESAYRGNVYESYYLNKTPFDSPKNASPDYINWASKKSNYKGGRYPNGVPMYVGRGLIQITHDYNYERYSSVVPGLLQTPELAMNVNNAWLIAMAYFKARNTLQKASSGDLTGARRSVNGGTNGIDNVNSTYSRWISVLQSCGCQENQGGSSIVSSNVVRGGPGSSGTSIADTSQGSTSYASSGVINGAGSNPGTPYSEFFAKLNQTINVPTDPVGENTGTNVASATNTSTGDNSINNSTQTTSEGLSNITSKPVSTIKENNTNTCG